MRKVTLYIADMDEAFVSRVYGAIVRHASIEIVGRNGNGAQSLKDVIRLSPDVLLVDIPLPGLDGIALLRECQRLKRPPSVVVCTSFYSPACMECARRYGAAFFLCKPIDPASLPELILECHRCKPPAQPMKSIEEDETARRRATVARSMLKHLGMPSNLSGSAYLVEAVVQLHNDALLMKNLSRGLYAELARRMNTTAARVERSLRSAIAVAYERGAMRERFHRRPSNKEFIEYMMRAVDEEEEATLP